MLNPIIVIWFISGSVESTFLVIPTTIQWELGEEHSGEWIATECIVALLGVFIECCSEL